MGAESRSKGSPLNEVCAGDEAPKSPSPDVVKDEAGLADAAEDRDESREVSTPSHLALLEKALGEHPTSFSFFQAVRLLERLRPRRVSVGGWGDPADEVVRFGVPPSFGFPVGEIHSLNLSEGEPPPADAPGAERWEEEEPLGAGRARMLVNFMGLIGPSGVLPHEYTKLVADRTRAKDLATGEFLDILHHRLLSLFYLAWKKTRLDVHMESPPPGGGLIRHLLDLMGLGIEGFQDRQLVDDETLVYYSGLLVPPTRSAAALEQLLEDRFDVPFSVEEFVGGFYPLARQDQCRLGDDEGGNRLGLGTAIGDEIWDQQGRVRLRIGPLCMQDFRRFLPGGEAHRELKSLVGFFSNEEHDFEVQLVLAGDEVPGVTLDGDAAEQLPLGWCTWMRSQARGSDADETTFTL